MCNRHQLQTEALRALEFALYSDEGIMLTGFRGIGIVNRERSAILIDSAITGRPSTDSMIGLRFLVAKDIV